MEEAVTDWVAIMEEHNRNIETLTLKLVGTATMNYGRNIADIFFKKQWYAKTIMRLGISIGTCKMRQYRCKSTESPLWKELEDKIFDLENVVDNLILEMISL